jgi:hypothetical protein
MQIIPVTHRGVFPAAAATTGKRARRYKVKFGIPYEGRNIDRETLQVANLTITGIT